LWGPTIVIAHNVNHRVPSEVPILFVLGWISMRVRDGGWKMVCLHKPDSWRFADYLVRNLQPWFRPCSSQSAAGDVQIPELPEKGSRARPRIHQFGQSAMRQHCR
jgi:hypothetical protein